MATLLPINPIRTLPSKGRGTNQSNRSRCTFSSCPNCSTVFVLFVYNFYIVAKCFRYNSLLFILHTPKKLFVALLAATKPFTRVKTIVSCRVDGFFWVYGVCMCISSFRVVFTKIIEFDAILLALAITLKNRENRKNVYQSNKVYNEGIISITSNSLLSQLTHTKFRKYYSYAELSLWMSRLPAWWQKQNEVVNFEMGHWANALKLVACNRQEKWKCSGDWKMATEVKCMTLPMQIFTENSRSSKWKGQTRATK